MNRQETHERYKRIADAAIAGLKLADICTTFAVSTETVREACHRHSVRFPAPPTRRTVAVARVAAGESLETVAAETGVGIKGLRDACRERGVLTVPGIPGSGCATVRIVAELFDLSKSIAEIASVCQAPVARVYQVYHQCVRFGVHGLPRRGYKREGVS